MSDGRRGQGFLDAHAAAVGARAAANLGYHLDEALFGGVEIEGRSILEIGSGEGDAMLWAASAGARRVVGLEPEVEGSREGMQEALTSRASKLGLDGIVELVPARLQDYEAEERFDVIVSQASINHLDEELCVRLHDDEEARRRYRELLSGLARVAEPGADLLVIDCDRVNGLSWLGSRHPLAPTIEWDKHQNPKLWASLLSDAGFEAPEITWLSLNPLRAPGQALLGNRLGSFFLKSAFRLRMRRSSELSP